MGLCLAVVVLLAVFTALLAEPREVAPTANSTDAEPVFAPAADQLLWSDSFDVAPRSRAAGRYGPYVTLGAPMPQFEADAGVDGSGAVRFDWTAARSARRDCADDSRLLEAAFTPTRELVVTFSVRYSRGFHFDWRGHGGCSGNAKKLFLLWAREGSRFVFISENGVLGVGSDFDHPLYAQNVGMAVTPAQLADGRWHRVTFRLRQGSTPTRADGAIHGWIDGVLRWRYDGIVTHNAGGYYLFKTPATFNAGSPVTQQEWLDLLHVWRAR